MTSQIGKFFLVGVSALLVHWLVVVILVSAGMPALVSNCYGFLVAFGVSYSGHRRWTFNGSSISHLETLPKFFSVSLSSFFLNEFLFYLMLKFTQIGYQVSLFLVLGVVASSTFILSKFWAFKSL